MDRKLTWSALADELRETGLTVTIIERAEFITIADGGVMNTIAKMVLNKTAPESRACMETFLQIRRYVSDCVPKDPVCAAWEAWRRRSWGAAKSPTIPDN